MKSTHVALASLLFAISSTSLLGASAISIERDRKALPTPTPHRISIEKERKAIPTPTPHQISIEKDRRVLSKLSPSKHKISIEKDAKALDRSGSKGTGTPAGTITSVPSGDTTNPGPGPVVIVPIVFPYPDAPVDAAPGQIVLRPGSRVNQNIATEIAHANHLGNLRVTTMSNGNLRLDPNSNVKLMVDASDCQSNHSYGVAIFSAATDWSKTPLKIGTLQTDTAGRGHQEIGYESSAWFPMLDFMVGLYEIDGQDLIAGPMAQASAGKLGCPRSP